MDKINSHTHPQKGIVFTDAKTMELLLKYWQKVKLSSLLSEKDKKYLAAGIHQKQAGTREQIRNVRQLIKRSREFHVATNCQLYSLNGMASQCPSILRKTTAEEERLCEELNKILNIYLSFIHYIEVP